MTLAVFAETIIVLAATHAPAHPTLSCTLLPPCNQMHQSGAFPCSARDAPLVWWGLLGQGKMEVEKS